MYSTVYSLYIISRCSIKSVLEIVRNSFMLVLRLRCVMVVTQHVVDTGQMHDIVKNVVNRL